MGAKLEINIISSNFICLDVIDNIKNSPRVSDFEMLAIDDWEYSNEVQISEVEDIRECIAAKQKVFIWFVWENITDCGIFIDKENDKYIYTIWFDTNNNPDYDCDYINDNNKPFYDELYKKLLEFMKIKFNIDYDIIAVGAETVFDWKGSIKKTIDGSKNIVSWIFPNRISENGNIIKSLSGYTHKQHQAFSCEIYEKHQ